MRALNMPAYPYTIFLVCLYGYVSLLLVVYILSGEAPYIKVCKQEDPDIANCIKNSVYALRSKLKEGIPELNVPPLEPLPLETIKLRSGPSNAKIYANITNLIVWGPSTFEIEDMRPNLRKNRFAFKVLLPHLYFEGDYDMDMKILLLEYKGQGPLTGNFTNYKFDCVLKGNIVKKDGEDHLKFDMMKLKLNLGQTNLHLGNLFKDDPVLGRATNDVINDNSDLFIKEIQPVLEHSLAERFTEIANLITMKFTYQELFP